MKILLSSSSVIKFLAKQWRLREFHFLNLSQNGFSWLRFFHQFQTKNSFEGKKENSSMKMMMMTYEGKGLTSRMILFNQLGQHKLCMLLKCLKPDQSENNFSNATFLFSSIRLKPELNSLNAPFRNCRRKSTDLKVRVVLQIWSRLCHPRLT